jgi:hypothetical protein
MLMIPLIYVSKHAHNFLKLMQTIQATAALTDAPTIPICTLTRFLKNASQDAL